MKLAIAEPARKLAWSALMSGMLALTACQATNLPQGLPEAGPAQATDAALPPAEGEVLGSGPVRVALLLPVTAPGNASVIATELRNAAAMAMEDGAASMLQLVIKDTGGTPEGAANAASEAVREQAALVLGPVFANSVSAATGVLRPNRKLMIAYSTDSNVAGTGVYLASYLPQTIIDRTAAYAANAGLRNMVALLPDGPIGDLAESQLLQTLARNGGQLIAAARYEYSDASVEAAISELAPAIASADAIFIPDGGNTPGAIVGTMQRRGIPLAGKKFLGTGQWASADLGNPALEGAWLADADHGSTAAFNAKYMARHGLKPSAIAPVAYDTVALVAGLARRVGAQGLTATTLEDRTGFSGYTGVFRFLQDGTNERGLAIYEVRGGQLHLVDPAPTSFRSGS